MQNKLIRTSFLILNIMEHTVFNQSRNFPSSLFDIDKYSFENTIENLNSVAEEPHDDAILYDIKEVIRDEKRFNMFLTF